MKLIVTKNTYLLLRKLNLMKKKSIISLFFFLFLSISTQAQIDFGIKLSGSLNSLYLNGDFRPLNNYSGGVLGFEAGITSRIKVDKILSFTPEILYVTNGNYYVSNNRNFQLEFDFSYLQIPMMFRILFNDYLGIEFGPYYGILLDARARGKINPYEIGLIEDTQPLEFDENIKSDITSGDFGVKLGAVFTVNENLFIDIHYDIGLQDVLIDEKSGINNRSINIGFGHTFTKKEANLQSKQ